MKVLSVVGNRPQFVKAAPVSRAVRAIGEEVLVHSGQHYDPALADLFFDELDIPEPDHALGVGPGTPTSQAAAIMRALEPILLGESPDAVLAYGDTTTTLAAAIAAAKSDVPLAHVEAGLRSFDKAMPEEQNRVVTDHLSARLYCPTSTAVENLTNEGITDGVELVGDVMYDASLAFAPAAEARPGARALGLSPHDYVLVTAHRAATTDTRDALLGLVAMLEAIDSPVVFPLHPRTRARLEAEGLLEPLQQAQGLVLSEPLGYLDFTSLLRTARAVVTDSGGVQKEALFHGVPCITLREETEWVETVSAGRNTLVGLDPNRLRAALAAPRPEENPPPLYGDGRSAERIASSLAEWLTEAER
jgi:UDP-N-acetylglucosamine 2-epimerase